MAKHTILHAEHELLGAVFDINPQTGYEIPISYGTPASTVGDKTSEAECCLFDVSGHTYQLIGGALAPSLVSDIFAGPVLDIGDLSFQPVFTGDGAVVSVVLVARSGDNEYFYLDISNHGGLLSSCIANYLFEKKRQGASSETVSLEDADQLLVPLFLAGPRAHEVLSDYLNDTQSALPPIGKLSFCLLDARIAALIGHVPLKDLDAYIVLVNPQQVQILWRSLLSFPMVVPIGEADLIQILSHELPWLRASHNVDETSISQDVHNVHGFVRSSRDFIGGQALQ